MIPDRHLNKAIVITLVVAAVLFWLLGCGKREEAQPPPSSSYSLEAVKGEATTWQNVDPSVRRWFSVANTGSMLPLFGSNSVLLCESMQGKRASIGDILLIDDLRGGTYCHTCTLVDADGNVRTRGYNNNSSDAYVERRRVLWRVIGILYAQR